MEIVFRDLRLALRALRKSWRLSAVAVLTLGLGIGAVSTMFSVVNGVLLQPLPYAEPERLVRVYDSSLINPRFPMAPGNLFDQREALGEAGELAAYVRRDAELTAGERSERLRGMAVSAGFFHLLRHEIVIGRDFERDDERVGGEPITIVSDRFWRHHLNADPKAVGRSVVLDGMAHTVVGVLAPGLQHVGGSFRSLPQGAVVDIWRPARLDPQRRNWHFMNAIARLAPGLSIERATARMNLVAERLAAQHPNTNADWRIAVVSLADDVVGATRPMLGILMGTVALVLLIAIVNVASLQLARATTRRREVAVRRAVGAGTASLLRLSMLEHLSIAICAGLLGLALAGVGIVLLRAWGPSNLPRLHAVELDLGVLVLTALVTIVSGLAFGAAPAMQVCRVPLQEIVSGVRGAVSDGSNRLRRALVVAQVTLAIVLLVGAGLLVESFRRMRAEAPGFASESAVTAAISLPRARYPGNEEGIAFYRRLRQRVGALPGAVAVGAGSDLPWTGYDENTEVLAEEWIGDRERSGVRSRYHIVTPGYFRALGVPILRGRAFDDGDDARAPQRVVISRRLAEALWGDGDPVGRRLTQSSRPTEDDYIQVVGVAGDVKDGPGGAQLLPSLYFPHAQKAWTSDLKLVVRTSIAPASVLESVRSELRAIDPDLPLDEIRTLDNVVDRSFATPRFVFLLVSGFAVVALVLATIGVYAVVSYSVGRRVPEMAVRAVLGASEKQIVGLVVREGLRMVSVGAILGSTGALVFAGVLRSLLYGVAPREPGIYAGAVALLGLVATLASLAPAMRAARVEPASALRSE